MRARKGIHMEWSKPDFVEITLGMEVTAYVNTDEESVDRGEWPVLKEDEATAVLVTDHEALATDNWQPTTDQ